eukprot:350777-Chlamydomonas_euryale.AAC.4
MQGLARADSTLVGAAAAARRGICLRPSHVIGTAPTYAARRARPRDLAAAAQARSSAGQR